MCFPYITKRNFVAKHGQDLSILYFCLLYLFVWPVCRFGYLFVVRPLK